MGTLILASTSSGSTAAKGSPTFTFLILAVLVVLFYVLIMRPQRNRQRKMQQQQSQVVPGQRVRTTAGMYGTVVSGDDRDVVIEISPGVHVTMLRRAIMDVVPEDDTTLNPDGMGPQGEEPEASFDSDHSSDGSESGHEDNPADEWDLKDRNI